MWEWIKKKIQEVKKKVALKWLAQDDNYVVAKETYPGYIIIDLLHDDNVVGDIWDFSRYEDCGVIGWTQIDDWSMYRGIDLKPVMYQGVVYEKEGGGYHFDWDVAQMVWGFGDEDLED